MWLTVPEAASSHSFQNTFEDSERMKNSPRKWKTKTDVPLTARSWEKIPPTTKPMERNREI